MSIKKIIISVFMIIIIFFLLLLTIISCALDGTSYNFQEHRKTESTRNSCRYTYQDKVRVETVRLKDEESSALSLRTKQSWDSSYTILSGDFEKIAWHDDVIYIMSDYKYYSFDINSYTYPQNNNPPVYELCEYSYSEFINSYPDYNEYDWFVP